MKKCSLYLKMVSAIRRQRHISRYSYLEEKQIYFNNHKSNFFRKRWYYRNYKRFWFKSHLRVFVRKLSSQKIHIKMLNLARWVLVDLLRGKGNKHWGIYCYVANPGEGKTLSMVAHMERVIKEVGRDKVFIATNFFYKRQDVQIGHWVDMIKAAKYAVDHGMYCIIAMDEIHITFDKSDWKAFPPEMLSLLSFNRKYNLQFLCSSQRYDRIPTKVAGISNYVVLCKNVWGLDRYFWNFYYPTINYDAKFDGKRAHSDFIRSYVAGDDLYNLYDTRRQIDNMMTDAVSEKDKRLEAFELLYGPGGSSGAG